MIIAQVSHLIDARITDVKSTSHLALHFKHTQKMCQRQDHQCQLVSDTKVNSCSTEHNSFKSHRFLFGEKASALNFNTRLKISMHDSINMFIPLEGNPFNW